MRHSIFSELIEEGLLNEAQLLECQEEERSTGTPIDKVLREKGYVSESAFLQALAKQLRLQFAEELVDFKVPENFIEMVPAQFARTYNLIAVGEEPGILLVATCDPLDVQPMDDLSAMVDLVIEPVISTRSEITALINRAYQKSSADVDELLEGLDDDELIGIAAEIDETEDVLDIANKAPIIKLMNTIMFEAQKNRASDIHLQPFADRLQVRYRIDGILYDTKVIPKKIQDALVSRVKVMGKMDIAERRLPQDGRTSVKIGDSDLDLRISSVPTSYGERIVFRLLDKSARLYTLTEIGLDDRNYQLLDKLVNSSHGVLLVTGPTGSGKSTTLYAALAEMDSQELNIITIEDPIEYNIDAISQIQVSNKKGLTFASGLRSLMRQDPDVMMVGEIRDMETAGIAVQASNTGHLVFSTLHTNDSAGAVNRMIDLGVEPYLVSSSLIGVVAQRLVRVICPRCKESYEPEAGQLKTLGLTREDLLEGLLYRGRGCDACLGRGYYDRTAIYEILTMNETIRDQIISRTSASVIKQTAVETGHLRTLRMDGARKVAQGITTVDEVFRVTQMDVF
ncbi:MAG: type II secretion system ATPase GspE [Planctomycetota bacterium]|nr:type II secretion system ATPase GspE [Planctomycetota bacterium]